VTLDRITVDPGVKGGMPCTRGLRMPVATVVAVVADGMTVAEIVDDLPDLEVDAVHVRDIGLAAASGFIAVFGVDRSDH